MEGNLLLSLQSGSALPLVFSYKNSRPIARWLFTAAVGSLLLLLLLGSGGFFLCVRFNRQRWMMSVISIAFGMWSLLKIPDDMENDIISGNEPEMEPKKRNIYAMNYYRVIFKKCITSIMGSEEFSSNCRDARFELKKKKNRSAHITCIH